MREECALALYELKMRNDGFLSLENVDTWLIGPEITNDIKDINEVFKTYFDLHKQGVEKAYIVACEDYDDGTSAGYAAMLLSIGDDTECYMPYKQAAAFLCLTGADSFILVHNHPDGNPHYSDGDKEVGEEYIQFAEMMKCRLLDNVIISSGGYSSTLTEEVFEFDNWD